MQFTDQSSNSPNKWNWDFGDGNLSTSKNPTHAYNSDGTFTVTLTVENDYGSDTEAVHAYMDDVLIETLEGLGYCCLLFKETEKWYA